MKRLTEAELEAQISRHNKEIAVESHVHDDDNTRHGIIITATDEKGRVQRFFVGVNGAAKRLELMELP